MKGAIEKLESLRESAVVAVGKGIFSSFLNFNKKS